MLLMSPSIYSWNKYWQRYSVEKQTLAQFAAKLGCSKRTIQSWLDAFIIYGHKAADNKIILFFNALHWGRWFSMMFFKDALSGKNLD